MPDTDNNFDVLVVGAGISGINAAHHVRRRFPSLRLVVLERRARVGGTWDLFRYPGVRSDTDLFSFGFAWNPWTETRAVADGPSIQRYLADTVRADGLGPHVRFGHRVLAASWASSEQRWTVEVQADAEPATYTARFLVLGTGYYDHDAPRPAVVPGLRDHFRGTVVHPQFWPADLDCAGKRVVVVGSGATAVTLLPALAPAAAKVTMLQRSPGYIASIDNHAAGTSLVRRLLPRRWSFALTRLSFIASTAAMWYYCRLFPRRARARLQREMARQLPPHVPARPHFEPAYDPWDQRLCLSPDGDFFASLRGGRADVVTGTVATATADALVLASSGQRVEADVVVTATGLQLHMGGHIRLRVDGRDVRLADAFAWRSALVQDVPNLALLLGYVNASWTLGAEVTCHLLCRLLQRMQDRGFASVVPRVPVPAAGRKETLLRPRPLWDLDATYVRQAADALPKCGDKGPWRGRTNYFLDLWRAKYGSITDGLEYVKVGET